MAPPAIHSTAKRDFAVCVAIVAVLFALAGYFDLNEKWDAWSRTHEDWELDEILTAAALSTLGFAWYAYRRWQESWREAGRRAEINRTLDLEIAAHQETERSLRESEERLNLASQLAKIRAWSWSAETRLTQYLPAREEVRDLWGRPASVALNSEVGLLQAIHPDDRQRLREIWDRAYVEHMPYEIEYRLVLPNGKVRHNHEIGMPEFDESGQYLGYFGTTQDVTDRKRAETLLKRAMDASPAVYALFDAADRLVAYNRKFREMCETPEAPIVPGVPFEKLIRVFAAKVGVGKSAAETEAWVAKRLDRRNAPAQSYEYRRGDGEWIEVSDILLDDNYIFTIGLIVTERKRMASALRQREAYLKAFIDHSSADIGIKDAAGRFVFLNPIGARHIGVSPEDAVGKTSHEILPREVADQVVAQDREVLETGKPSRREIVREDGHDGRRIFSAVKFPIYDTDGQLLGLGAIATDITERVAAERALRESEARFRGFVEHLPLSIVLKDLDGRFVLVNDVFAKRYGMTLAEVAGKTDYDLHAKETADLYARHNSDVLENGEAISHEFQVTLADGSARSVIVTKFPIRDAQGRVSSIGSIGIDITDRKQAEEQLRQAQKMEALGQLTGGVAHDFNNMLTAIIGNLEILGDRVEGDDDARKSLDIALRAALNAAGLTRRLLTFSRQQTLDRKVVDLRAMISGMRGLLRSTLGAAVELRLVLPGNTRNVSVDTVQLESAIINLAANARNAMPKGGRLTIETANADFGQDDTAHHGGIAPGPYVVLSVSDTGSGMSPTVKERVFEPFFTTKQVGEGTGLGLSTVFGFMKQLGGTVALDSEEGRGTRAKLYLPAGGAVETEAARPGPPSDDFPGRGGTILVVEDDVGAGETVSAILDGLGYRVLLAENGPAALALLEEHRDIDLLFTDTVMPEGMSGFDLARKALERFPGLKVLRTSAYPENALDPTRRIEEEIDWIAKPYLSGALAAKIREVMEKPETRPGTWRVSG